MAHHSLITYDPAWIRALKPGDQVDLVIPSIVGIHATLTVYSIDSAGGIYAGKTRQDTPSKFLPSGANVDGYQHGILVARGTPPDSHPLDHADLIADDIPAWLNYLRPGDEVVLEESDPCGGYYPGLVLQRVSGGYLDILNTELGQVHQMMPNGEHSWRPMRIVHSSVPAVLNQIRQLRQQLGEMGQMFVALGQRLVEANFQQLAEEPTNLEAQDED